MAVFCRRIIPSEWINHFSIFWLIKRAEIVTQLLIRCPIQNVSHTDRQKELWWEWQTWSGFLPYTSCQQLRIASILLTIMLILWFNYLFQLYTLIVCTCVVIQACCITLQNQISMQCQKRFKSVNLMLNFKSSVCGIGNTNWSEYWTLMLIQVFQIFITDYLLLVSVSCMCPCIAHSFLSLLNVEISTGECTSLIAASSPPTPVLSPG